MRGFVLKIKQDLHGDILPWNRSGVSPAIVLSPSTVSAFNGERQMNWQRCCCHHGLFELWVKGEMVL